MTSHITVQKCTFKEPKVINYCKDDGKFTFSRPFLLLDEATFDENENENDLERSFKCNISDTFT